MMGKATNNVNRRGILEGLKEAVIKFDEARVVDLSNEALRGGLDPLDAIMNGLAAGMEVVGDLFSREEYFVPEVLMCADALNAGLSVLKPHLKQDADRNVKGQVVIGTVEGDIHDIGKNIVKMMFEMAGFIVHDLGRDVPLDRFVEEQLRTESEIVCLSALMTTTMMGMKKVIEKIKVKNPTVLVMVGGAPVTKMIAENIGADGYAPNANNAVQEAIRMVSALRKMKLTKEKPE